MKTICFRVPETKLWFPLQILLVWKKCQKYGKLFKNRNGFAFLCENYWLEKIKMYLWTELWSRPKETTYRYCYVILIVIIFFCIKTFSWLKSKEENVPMLCSEVRTWVAPGMEADLFVRGTITSDVLSRRVDTVHIPMMRKIRGMMHGHTHKRVCMQRNFLPSTLMDGIVWCKSTI